MSLFTECIGCLEQEVDLVTLLRLTILVDSDGSYYLNTKFNEKEQCDDYSPIECTSHVTVPELLKRLIVEDDCGNCAWNFIANICDACD